METLWEKKRKGNFECYIDGVRLASLSSNGNEAVITTADGSFVIHRKGFWRPRLVIADQDGAETALIPIKVWGCNARLEWKGQTYEFRMQNNPLAEASFWKEGKLILSYGLTTVNRKPTVRINRTHSVDPILDGMLFYMMRAIFQEQGACDVSSAIVMMSI